MGVVQSAEESHSREDRYEVLDDFPPSTKLVYKTLSYGGGMSQSQLADKAMLTKRTVRDAISKLKGVGLVEERVNTADARRKVYRTKEVKQPE